eukprot:scpid58078/ scgid33882/ 
MLFRRKYQVALQTVNKLKKKISGTKQAQQQQQVREQVNIEKEKKTIKTLEGRPRAIRMQCASAVFNCSLIIIIGVNHVSPVIWCVMETLTGHQVDRLPSPAKMCDFLAKSKQPVLTQIGDPMLMEDNVTLHHDGTSNQGHKYYMAQLATPDNILSLGLAPVKSGTAEHSFEAGLTMLSDAEQACRRSGSDMPVARKLISSIKNTMTDRRSVEKSVNKMLETYRTNILPEMAASWTNLPEPVGQTVLSVNTVYCGLHCIVLLAEQALEVLRIWEKAHFDTTAVGASSQGFENTGEAGSVRLIRTACKALEAHCNEQPGNHVQFRSYLLSKGVECIPLARFVGNPFNVIFYNAAGIILYESIFNGSIKMRSARRTTYTGLFWLTFKSMVISQHAGPSELSAS